jgi:hypothetical protein
MAHILNFSPSPKVMISVPDGGLAEQCDNYLVTKPRFSVQPYLLPNTLDCLRRAVGLAGAYRLTSAGCKKVFNKGVLPVAHIWSHIKEGDRKTLRSRGNITVW